MAMAKEKRTGGWGDLTLASFGTSILTALFIFLLEIVFVVSFTALIYSGDLSSQIPRALGFIILGDAVLCLVGALLSSNPGAILVEQDATGAMLSVVAMSIIAALAGSVSHQFATVTMMIVLTTTVTGLVLVAIGYFKLGGLVRFLPYPVVGGFLAGTGWLLIHGGIGMMVDAPMGMALLQASTLLLWAPGAVLGVAIYALSRKTTKPYAIPALLLVASLLFYGIAWSAGASLAQLQQGGWLLEFSVSGGGWQFALGPDLLSQVDWGVLFRHAPALIPITVICVVDLLLSASAMELVIKKDTNLNRELMAAGIGNLAAGLTGGLVGFQDVSFSTLSHSMSGGKRLVGVAVALLLAATLFVGLTAVLYIPKFVFGSVLIFLGVQLLSEWVYEAWKKFPRVDFLVVVIILLVIVLSGFLEGIVAGLALAIILFAVSYSRIRVIRLAISGRDYRSRVTRNSQQQKLLDQYGNQIQVLKLEGFIFFGTANGIFAELRERFRPSADLMAKYIMLDFAKVTGIDSTGMLSFARMIQWSREQGLTLVLTGLTGNTLERFVDEGAQDEQGRPIQFLPDLDHGLEWCENALLAEYDVDQPQEADLRAQLAGIVSISGIEKVIPYLRRRAYAPGEYLVRQGDQADLMYFIESGQVTALLESAGGKPVRLETMYGGRTVGEMGFYRATRRTASVVADQPTVVYSLSADDLRGMENDDPEAASIFHRMMVILLSERVAHLSRTVGALERA